MKKRIPVAEKRARRVISLAGSRQQATGTHCELSGVWESPAGLHISLYEGQLLPTDSSRACLWTYVGFQASKTGSHEARLAAPEHHRL
jgi:hypothetical protein